MSAVPKPAEGQAATLDQSENLRLMMELASVYHNHKEQMALSIFGLQGAVFVGLFLMNTWPTDVMAMGRRPMVVIFVVVWVLFHLALRYQLRNRRLAAITVAAYADALLQTEAIHFEKSSHAYRPPGWLARLTDRTFLPVRGALRSADVELADLPDGTDVLPRTRRSFQYHFAKHQNESAVSWTKYALPIEWLTSAGSIVLLIIVLYRVLSMKPA